MNNKTLIKKYPWLQIRNNFTGELLDPEYYELTWLDDMPNGWRKAFGLQMVEELDQLLKKVNYQDKYRISQIKEKYGELRLYDNGVPMEISKEYNKLLYKYEELSRRTCIVCGEPGEIDYKQYWLMPLCNKCKKESW